MPENKLSLFVDESGDFGFNLEGASNFYIFSIVFHDQNIDISTPLALLENRLAELGFPNHCFHTGPIIRKEAPYNHTPLDVRRKMLRAMRFFARHINVKIHSFVFDKKHWNTLNLLQARMAKELGAFLKEHISYFHPFDSIVLYYDNGQTELGKVLNSSLNVLIDVEAKLRVKPTDYRLFQLADFACTLELVDKKRSMNMGSEAEKIFFKAKELDRIYLPEIRNKDF